MCPRIPVIPHFPHAVRRGRTRQRCLQLPQKLPWLPMTRFGQLTNILRCLTYTLHPNVKTNTTPHDDAHPLRNRLSWENDSRAGDRPGQDRTASHR